LRITEKLYRLRLPQLKKPFPSVMVRIVDVVISKSLMETVTQIQTVEEGSNVEKTIVGEAKDLPSMKPMTAATTLKRLRNRKDLTVARLDLLPPKLPLMPRPLLPPKLLLRPRPLLDPKLPLMPKPKIKPLLLPVSIRTVFALAGLPVVLARKALLT
jgi:hypothetical protein